MGLLEEAIREHLELQRRRGGDPREIAVAEREALEPLVPGQTPDWAQGPALFDHAEPGQADPMPSGRSMAEPGQADAMPSGRPMAEPGQADAMPSGRPLAETGEQVAEAPALEQETAELDMSAVLGIPGESGAPQLDHLTDQPRVPEFGPVRAQRMIPDPAAPVAGAEDFEWEIPGLTRSHGSGA
jgi:hypothetical protein